MRTPNLLLMLTAAATTMAEDFPPGAIETARESVVQVFGNSRIKGGGVVMDREGLVLTACHLAEGTNMAFTVEYPDGQRISALPLAVDVQADLMLLTPTAAVSNATPAAFTRREVEGGRSCAASGRRCGRRRLARTAGSPRPGLVTASSASWGSARASGSTTR